MLLCNLPSPLPWLVLYNRGQTISVWSPRKRLARGWAARGHLWCPPDTLVPWAASRAGSILVRLAQNGGQLAARLGQQGLTLLPAAGGSHAAAHGICSRMRWASAAALVWRRSEALAGQPEEQEAVNCLCGTDRPLPGHLEGQQPQNAHEAQPPPTCVGA